MSVLLYVFFAVAAIQLVYYLGIFSKFAFSKPQQATPKKIAVSVIVCAKNEAENVKRFLPNLINQDYPEFELVLIDDASTDDTLQIFEDYAKLHSNIKIVKVENNEAFWGNKKYALTLGIKAAKYEYLLFTDADCNPVSPSWIREMSSHFTQQKTIVLGYGAYDKLPGFLNKLIRFETLLTAVQYFSWAKHGLPYMGVGRNMAYKREEFFRVRGFMDHMKLRSGDDDLFINQAGTAKNTATCYTPDSFTYSEPKTTFKEWFTQKRRHVSVAGHYKTFDKIQLGIFYASQFLFFIGAVVLLAFMYEWIMVAAVVGVRYLVTWLVMGFSAAKLKEKDTVYFYPVMEIALIMVQLNVFLSNIFSKPVHWK
jgi:glycosyltransferase involved in cell wall biosynthesis